MIFFLIFFVANFFFNYFLVNLLFFSNMVDQRISVKEDLVKPLNVQWEPFDQTRKTF